jgi:Flp pilus assembly protein TadG
MRKILAEPSDATGRAAGTQAAAGNDGAVRARAIFAALRLRTRRAWRDRKGVSALEFSLVASMMITLMLGAFDFGNAAQQNIQLQEAVRAGGAYALQFPTNVTGIQSAVRGAMPRGWTLSSAPSVVCECQGSSGGITTTTCATPSCAAGSAKLVKITATMPYSALLFTGALTNNTANYVVRYQ